MFKTPKKEAKKILQSDVYMGHKRKATKEAIRKQNKHTGVVTEKQTALNSLKTSLAADIAARQVKSQGVVDSIKAKYSGIGNAAKLAKALSKVKQQSNGTEVISGKQGGKVLKKQKAIKKAEEALTKATQKSTKSTKKANTIIASITQKAATSLNGSLKTTLNTLRTKLGANGQPIKATLSETIEALKGNLMTKQKTLSDDTKKPLAEAVAAKANHDSKIITANKEYTDAQIKLTESKLKPLSQTFTLEHKKAEVEAAQTKLTETKTAFDATQTPEMKQKGIELQKVVKAKGLAYQQEYRKNKILGITNISRLEGIANQTTVGIKTVRRNRTEAKANTRTLITTSKSSSINKIRKLEKKYPKGSKKREQLSKSVAQLKKLEQTLRDTKGLGFSTQKETNTLMVLRKKAALLSILESENKNVKNLTQKASKEFETIKSLTEVPVATKKGVAVAKPVEPTIPKPPQTLGGQQLKLKELEQTQASKERARLNNPSKYGDVSPNEKNRLAEIEQLKELISQQPEAAAATIPKNTTAVEAPKAASEVAVPPKSTTTAAPKNTTVAEPIVPRAEVATAAPPKSTTTAPIAAAAVVAPKNTTVAPTKNTSTAPALPPRTPEVQKQLQQIEESKLALENKAYTAEQKAMEEGLKAGKKLPELMTLGGEAIEKVIQEAQGKEAADAATPGPTILKPAAKQKQSSFI